jgi:tetratricopeptide (TPR) repeat protein
MAFGFGFNKQKVLSAAEKFVQQGKLQNAIAEYEKVLKADPKDLTVTNTVGDLYARLGENDKAIDCFKSVGDAYATQGFTVKAIAMYKKLTKIKSSLESVLRLAELYTQQGLFNDARAQYLQVADEFLKAGELEQAVRIFQKTLEMDPDNTAMRMKLADVYIRLGKKNEAWQIYAAAAENLRSKGALDKAEEILNKMLKLDPSNSYARLLQGRTAFDAGDLDGAIENLEKVPDLDSNPDGLKTLLHAYLQSGRLPDAGNLAAKLLSVHGDTGAILSYAETLVSAAQFEAALQTYDEYSDRLLAADSAKVLESLHSIIGHVRENTSALESLIHLFNKAGENTHVAEIYELLAHAYVQSGELDRAREYYQKLIQLEPQNQLHVQNLQQVAAKSGGSAGAKLITAEEGAVLVDELEATAPFIEQRYSNEVALAIRDALTDAELFISYNMPEKAMGPLLSALPQAPRDLRLNQRLAALHTRAGRFAEAAVSCRILESLYHDAGYPDEASRYGELASKYEERAAIAPEASVEAPQAPATWPTTPVAEVQSAPGVAPASSASSGLSFDPPETNAKIPAPQEPQDFQTEVAATENEIDLSEEWADSHEPATVPVEEPVAAAPAPAQVEAVDNEAVAQVAEEVRFYLANGMVEEATASLGKLEELHADTAILSTLRAELKATRPRPVEPEPVQEIPQAVPEPEEEFASVPPVVAAPPLVEVEKKEEPVTAVAAAATGPVSKADDLGSFVSQLESSIQKDTTPKDTAKKDTAAKPPEPVAVPPAAVSTPAKVVAEAKPVPEAVAPAPAPPAAKRPREVAPANSLGDFVADLERSLGEDFFPSDAPASEPAVAAAQPWPTTAPTETPAPQPVAAAASVPAAAPPAPVAMAAAAAASNETLSQLVPQRPSAPSQPPVPAAASTAGVDLADMFGELKQELEQDVTTTEEDPETHYNLGVAFREMGLLDEAIGELQKVCASVERGHPFAQLMQTYTWLAQCFLDKGVPEAAVRWYEQALKLPNLDQETRVALHYELAGAHESAQNKPAALTHFMEVYGNNIDYRDVAERIKVLKS